MSGHHGTRIVWTPGAKPNMAQINYVCRDCGEPLPHAATRRLARERHVCVDETFNLG